MSHYSIINSSQHLTEQLTSSRPDSGLRIASLQLLISSHLPTTCFYKWLRIQTLFFSRQLLPICWTSISVTGGNKTNERNSPFFSTPWHSSGLQLPLCYQIFPIVQLYPQAVAHRANPHIHPVITAHPFIESPLCLSNSSVHSWMDRSFHSL